MVEVEVEFKYEGEQEDELSISIGDIIKNVVMSEGGWWEGELNGKKGMFPDNFVKVIKEKKDVKKEETKKDVQASKRQSVRDLANKIKSQVPENPVVGRRKDVPHVSTKLKKAKVTFTYEPENEDELKLEVGETVEIKSQVEEGWWEGLLNGKSGMFPSNFVELIEDDDGSPSEKAEDVNPIKGKKIMGVGLGNIFSEGPIKLRSTVSKKPGEKPEPKEKKPDEEPVVMRRKQQDTAPFACSPIPAPRTKSIRKATNIERHLEQPPCKEENDNFMIQSVKELEKTCDSCKDMFTENSDNFVSADQIPSLSCHSNCSSAVREESLVDFEDVDIEIPDCSGNANTDQADVYIDYDYETAGSSEGSVSHEEYSGMQYTCVNENAKIIQDEGYPSFEHDRSDSFRILSVLEDLDRCLTQSLSDSSDSSERNTSCCRGPDPTEGSQKPVLDKRHSAFPQIVTNFAVETDLEDEMSPMPNIDWQRPAFRSWKYPEQITPPSGKFERAVDSVYVTKKRRSTSDWDDATPTRPMHFDMDRNRASITKNLKKELDSVDIEQTVEEQWKTNENTGDERLSKTQNTLDEQATKPDNAVDNQQDVATAETNKMKPCKSPQTYFASLNKSGHLSPFIKVIANRYSLSLDYPKPARLQVDSVQEEEEDSYSTFMLRHSVSDTKLKEPVQELKKEDDDSGSLIKSAEEDETTNVTSVTVASLDAMSTTAEVDDYSVRFRDFSIASRDDVASSSDSDSLSSSAGVLAMMAASDTESPPLGDCSASLYIPIPTSTPMKAKPVRHFKTPKSCTIDIRTTQTNSNSWFCRDQEKSLVEDDGFRPERKTKPIHMEAELTKQKIGVQHWLEDTGNVLLDYTKDVMYEEINRPVRKRSSFCRIPFADDVEGCWYEKHDTYSVGVTQMTRSTTSPRYSGSKGENAEEKKKPASASKRHLPDSETPDDWYMEEKKRKFQVPSLMILAGEARQKIFYNKLVNLVGHHLDIGKEESLNTSQLLKESTSPINSSSVRPGINVAEKTDIDSSSNHSQPGCPEYFRSMLNTDSPRSPDSLTWNLFLQNNTPASRENGSTSTLKSGRLLNVDLESQLVKDCMQKRKRRPLWKKAFVKTSESLPVTLLSYRQMGDCDIAHAPPSSSLDMGQTNKSFSPSVQFEELEGSRLQNFLNEPLNHQLRDRMCDGDKSMGTVSCYDQFSVSQNDFTHKLTSEGFTPTDAEVNIRYVQEGYENADVRCSNSLDEDSILSCMVEDDDDSLRDARVQENVQEHSGELDREMKEDIEDSKDLTVPFIDDSKDEESALEEDLSLYGDDTLKHMSENDSMQEDAQTSNGTSILNKSFEEDSSVTDADEDNAAAHVLNVSLDDGSDEQERLEFFRFEGPEQTGRLLYRENSPDTNIMLKDMQDVNLTATPQYATNAAVDEEIEEFIQGTLQSFDNIFMDSFHSDVSDISQRSKQSVGQDKLECVPISVSPEYVIDPHVSPESPIPDGLISQSPDPAVDEFMPELLTSSPQPVDVKQYRENAHNFYSSLTESPMTGFYYHTEGNLHQSRLDTTDEYLSDVMSAGDCSFSRGVDYYEDVQTTSPAMASPDRSFRKEDPLYVEPKSGRSTEVQSLPTASGDDVLHRKYDLPPTEGSMYMKSGVPTAM